MKTVEDDSKLYKLRLPRPDDVEAWKLVKGGKNAKSVSKQTKRKKEKGKK